MITPAEREILNLYRIASTPKVDLTRGPLYRSLNGRGLLSIKAVDGNRHIARVETTEAGMQAVRDVEGRG